MITLFLEARSSARSLQMEIRYFVGSVSRSNYRKNRKLRSRNKIKSSNRANQTTQSQNTITKMCKDASGVSSTDFYYPMVSPNQYQGGITIIQPPNLILDGTCFLQYPVEANTTVNLILRYDVVGKQSNPLPTTFTSAPTEQVFVKVKPKKKKKKSFFRF